MQPLTPFSRIVSSVARVQLQAERALLWDGVFASASEAAVLFLPLYLTLFGASTTEMALLPVGAALTGLVALGPGALLTRRLASPKVLVLLGGGGGARVLLGVMACAPLLIQGRGLIYLLIALMAARNFISSLAHPAWVAVFASVVPSERVAQYTARRNFWVAVVAAAAFPIVGLAVDQGGPGGFTLIIGAATVLGFVSTCCYALIREPVRSAATVPAIEAQLGHSIPGTSRPDRFLLMCLLLHTATMVAAPYFVLHLSRNLGASPAMIGWLTTMSAVATVAGQLGARWLTARCDSRRLLSIALVALPLAPLSWLFVQQPWQAAIPYTVAGIGWAVTHIVCFDLMLKLSRGGSLPAIAAQQQGTVLLGALLGPLAGAWFGEALGMQAVFAVSAVLTACAGFVYMLPTLVWLRPAPTGGRARGEWEVDLPRL